MAQAALALPHPPPDSGRLELVSTPASAGVPPARLELAPYDLRVALALRRELGIGHVLAQVLARRGFSDPAKAREFLEPRERHDPGRFSGIEWDVGSGPDRRAGPLLRIAGVTS